MAKKLWECNLIFKVELGDLLHLAVTYILKLDRKAKLMCSMMFCKQMRLTHVMLVLLHDRLINNIKMEPRLSFEQWKVILKWYRRTENVEVQRQWRREYGAEPATRLTIARICDKFETHGTMCDVNKGGSGRPLTSKSPTSPAMVATVVIVQV